MGERTEAIGNWGRWGDQDERGTLNYLTPEVVRKAAGIVKQGKVYSLALPWNDLPAYVERGKPLHLMQTDGGDYAAGLKRAGGHQGCADFIIVHTHSTAHVDALCHVWRDDKLYNGFSGNTVTSAGAKYCGIDKMKWLFARGILLDVAGHKDEEHLEEGYIITPADLESCAQSEGVNIQPGDALLVRTGWLNVLVRNPEKVTGGRPGIGVAVAKWVGDKEVCCVASDTTGVEVRPQEREDQYLPVHEELIRNQGVYMMELLTLEELARDRVYEFLFVVAPLPIPGGSGSPVNPLAIA